MEAKFNDSRLFTLCRRGDTDKVKFLMETTDVDLNVRDRWDSTPLYYACLCGHEKLVEYLLENGARCEANTFDGERCFYAALNQRIKDMLKQFKAVTACCFRRDLFSECLRQCFETPKYEDICFDVHDVSIPAHRIILAARCPYMMEMIETRWKDKYKVKLKNSMMQPRPFRSFLQYIYTGRVDISLEDVDTFLLLCKQCRMNDLCERVKKSFQHYHSYADLKPRYMRERISVISVESDVTSNDVGESFVKVVENILPSCYRDQQFPSYWLDRVQVNLMEDCDDSSLDDHFYFDCRGLFSDICFVVENVPFFCHRIFACGRSEYFKALVHFQESMAMEQERENNNLEVTLHDVPADVFAVIITFIYTDNCLIPDQLVMEILHYADMFLLPGLKRQCAVYLSEHLTPSNVVPTLKIARLYEFDRLELICCEFIAGHLEEVVYQDEFGDLVREDAAAIRNRQETDSVVIVDDIRFHINRSLLPGAQTEDESDLTPGEKLKLLDDILLSLGIDV